MLFAITAACAGNHGTALVPSQSARRTTKDIGTAQNGNLVLNGTIVSTTTDEFTISTGPSECGLLDIHTSSSTSYEPSTFTPATGNNVTVSGTGSCSTDMSSTSEVTENNLTVGGTISGVATGHFTISTGSNQCGMLNVYYANITGLSPASYTPATGDNVFAIGYGTCSTNIQAGQIVKAPASAPYHMNDYAYWHADDINISVSPNVMASDYNYAETGSASTGTYGNEYLGAGGVHSVEYIDPNLINECPESYSDSATPTPAPCSTETEDFGHYISNVASDYLHDADDNRLHIIDDGYAEDRTNPHTTEVQTGVNTITSGFSGDYNLVFMDDTQTAIATSSETVTWASPAVSPYPPAEYPDPSDADAQFTSDMEAMIAESNFPVLMNVGKQNPTYNTTLLTANNVYGLVIEDCFTDGGPNGEALNTSQNPFNSSGEGAFEWEADFILTATSLEKYSLCLNIGTELATRSPIEDRLYDLGSYLLVYDPTYTIIAGEFPSPSPNPSPDYNYAEHSLVPESPLQSATNLSVDSLATTNGVYVREFDHCFLGGTYNGPCAVLVNPTTGAITLPNPLPVLYVYHHAMQLTSSAWSDGGTAYFSAPAPSPSATLAPESATILGP
jgi:hypothetical protein